MLIALAALLAACGGDSQQEPSVTAEEALRRVQELVDATLAEVAPNAQHSPEGVAGGTTCEDSLTGPTGQRSYGYGFSFPAPDEATGQRLVAEAAKFWEERGLPVDRDLDDPVAPAVRTGGDGFIFRFMFARRSKTASIIGSTPCVDPLPGDA